MKGTILLVEDELMTRMIETKALEGFGFDIVVASSAEEALEKLNQDTKIVFMDIGLPGIDGIEATKRIRAKGGYYAKLPIVAVSANDDLGYKQRMLDAGADLYVPKPITSVMMEPIVKRFAAVS